MSERRVPGRMRLEGPAVWTGAQMGARRWWRDLTGEEIDAMAAEAIDVERSCAGDLDALVAVTRAHAPRPVLDRLAAEVVEDLVHGKGFVVLRGIPVHRWSKAQVLIAYWLLGCRVGRPVANNAQGDMVGHVRDLGVDYHGPAGRGYNSRARLTFHVDQCDVVALMCLNPAKRGGESRLVSGAAVYNFLLENDPVALDALCEPFCMTRTGEIGPGEAPWYEVPVFEPRDGAANCIGSVNFVLKGHDLPGAPALDAARVAALERFEILCRENAFAMDFRRGDIQFLNNGLVVHTRTAFEDWPERDRRRHLLRLWLSAPDMHPGVAWFRIWRNGVAVTDGYPRVRLSP